MSNETETAEAPEIPVVTTAFAIVVDANGVVQVHTQQFPALQVQRVANLDDIEMYAQFVAASAQRAQMANLLNPPAEASAADRVADALAKRSQE